MVINLMFLVQMGISENFINKFPHLIQHLKSNDGYDADISFKLDEKAEKWIKDILIVKEEGVLNGKSIYRICDYRKNTNK